MKMASVILVCSWVVIALTIAWQMLWGIAIASPSVVNNRQVFLEFGISSLGVVVAAGFVFRLYWKISAGLFAVYFLLCINEGWSNEFLRFKSGSGGDWLSVFPASSVAVLFSLAVAIALRRCGRRRKVG